MAEPVSSRRRSHGSSTQQDVTLASRSPGPRGSVPGSTSGNRSHDGAADAAYSLLHDRLRLGIVSALAGAETLTFVELKSLLDATDGNLSVHARRLEDAGYVTCHKTFADRRPRSEYRLTPQGRRALQRYLDHMEALIEHTRRNLER